MYLWIIAAFTAYFIKGLCGFANTLVFYFDFELWRSQCQYFAGGAADRVSHQFYPHLEKQEKAWIIRYICRWQPLCWQAASRGLCF